MPYYQRLDTGETTWRPPLTPARAAGTIRIHGADPSRIGPGLHSVDNGSGLRYTVGFFMVVPARVPCGHRARANTLTVPGDSLLETEQQLPGQVAVAAAGGIRMYTEVKRAAGVRDGLGLGGQSSVWTQETAVASDGGGGSRGGSSGGGGGRASIPYNSTTGQVRCCIRFSVLHNPLHSAPIQHFLLRKIICKKDTFCTLALPDTCLTCGRCSTWGMSQLVAGGTGMG
jgi:hypothetical protein